MNNKDRRSSQFSDLENRLAVSIKESFVPNISQEEINKVCKIANSYYSTKQSIWDKSFWRVTLSCVTADTAFLWLMAAFILGSCAVLTLIAPVNSYDPVGIMTALAPVPLLVFIIREMQYRDPSLAQVEKSCKFQPSKIYFARLWVGMIINAIVVFCIGFFVYGSYANTLQMYFCSFIAMFLVGAVALLLMSLLDNELPLSLTLIVWVFVTSALLSNPDILYVITNISTGLFICIAVFSIGVFATTAKKATAKMYA